MDIVAENLETAAPKLLEEAGGGPNSSETANLATAATSSTQAPFLPSSGLSATCSPSPVQFEPRSLASRILVPSPTPNLPPDTRAAEMSLALAEPSTASMTFFSSSPVVSSPSSLSNDTPGLVVPASSSSVLDSSLAAGNAFTASPVSSYDGSPAFSRSLTSVPSVAPATSAPVSYADMIQVVSGGQFSDAHSESLGCTLPLDTRQPDVPSAAAGLNTSALFPTLPSSLPSVEGPVPPPVEMSSEMAAVVIGTSSFPPIGVSKDKHSSVAPSTSTRTDNPSTLLSSISQTSSHTEFPPDAPSYSLEELSALPAPSEANLDLLTSSPTLSLPAVPETDPLASTVPLVGASTGLLNEHERSSLETTTSFPSGTSTIATPSPSLISELRATFPTHAVCKFPNPSSVSTFKQSSIGPKLEPSFLTDPTFAYSMSTSCLALLSSVEVASFSPVASLQMPTNPVASLSSPPASSFGRLSPCSVIPESRVSSLPFTAPCSDSSSSGNRVASTTPAPSIVSHSLGLLSPISLNSSTACDSAIGDLPSGSGNAMDCSPLLSNRLTNMNSNSASSMSNFSPTLPDLRSFNDRLLANSGPPVAPTSEAFPRRPARGGQKGEGWPYAPQGWPECDDKWPWRVGKKMHVNGYFRDRFLGLPKGLCKGRSITEFSSKKSIVEYLKENFPDLSVENFFKSFQWRVPYVNYRNSCSAAALKANALKRQRPTQEDADAPNASKRSKKECRAGNPKCGLETGRSILLGDHAGLACNICCTEPGFCRECKCILCCKTIVPEAGECNFVRCLQKPSGDGICGHVSHLECALHSKMAGVVKKRSLDMEYLCRRCDSKTDLRELVTLLLEAVGNTDLRTQAEKSLALALEVMKGTERGGSGARVLESLVQTALKKVQSGVDIREAFRELKDQGAAAEAARQQSLVRGPPLVEDVAQQPEASLDQWLPSSGSPSSHPSPGTPSSFTSPRMRSNPSVTSGQLNGIQNVDGPLGKHTVAEGHTDHFGEPQTSPEVISNSNYKNSHLGNKPLIRGSGQARGSHRMRAVSSNANNNGHEAICDSYNARTTGNQMAEPGSRDGNSSQRVNLISNSGTKNPKDQRNPSTDAGLHREDVIFTEICRSCGTVRRHTSNALEVTSSRRFPKIEDGRKKVLHGPFVPREDPGDSDNYKHVAESDTGVDQSGHPSSTFSANASACKAVGTSLQLLDSQCERDVHAALQKLRQSQEAEFERAKECLTAQKDAIVRKYALLEADWSEFSEQPVLSSLDAFDELLLKTANQFSKAIEERENFKMMLKVGEGFGSVSRDDLSKFYGWPPEK